MLLLSSGKPVAQFRVQDSGKLRRLCFPSLPNHYSIFKLKMIFCSLYRRPLSCGVLTTLSARKWVCLVRMLEFYTLEFEIMLESLYGNHYKCLKMKNCVLKNGDHLYSLGSFEMLHYFLEAVTGPNWSYMRGTHSKVLTLFYLKIFFLKS